MVLVAAIGGSEEPCEAGCVGERGWSGGGCFFVEGVLVRLSGTVPFADHENDEEEDCEDCACLWGMVLAFRNSLVG